MAEDKSSIKALILVVVCVGAGAFLTSCSLFKPDAVAMLPLSIPGATYVGMETCATCHKTEHQYFTLSEHASVTIKSNPDDNDQEVKAEGCETCHGPGSLHVEGRGDKTKILLGRPEACYTCHLDIKGKFQLQHHHPVPEGQMKCSDCHTMHGSSVRDTGGLALDRKDTKCFACHKEQKGPFVFEHDAMRDGCQVCHNPHGSINDKLLVAGQTVTCLRCHWQASFNTATGKLGGVTHGGYFIGQGEDCVDHHRAVHGSNIWRTFNR